MKKLNKSYSFIVLNFLFMLFTALLFTPNLQAIADVSAESRSHFKFYLYNPEMRTDRSESQATQLLPTQNYSFGFQWQRLTLSIEYQEFSDTSLAGATEIKRTNKEILSWLDYHYAQFTRLNFYSGLGAGANQGHLQTRFLGRDYFETTPTAFLFGLKTGSELHVPILTSTSQFLAGIEIQALFGEMLDPVPSFGFLFKSGIAF